MALDLNVLPAHFLAKYGRDKVAEIVQKPVGMVTLWEKNGRFTIDALQRLLTFDPGPLGAVTPLYSTTDVGSKLAILMPCNGAPQPETVECLMKLYDPRDMVFKRVGFNNLSVARNSLAAWWLAGPCEWALWFDADSVAPCSDPQWFKETMALPQLPDIWAGFNAIHRLLVHKRKNGVHDALMVSGVYVGRRKGAAPQFGGGDTPDMRALIRRGPQDKLIEIPWCGFGFVLMHRKVLEDVIAQQGDEIAVKSAGLRKRFNYSHSIFTPIDQEAPGDDVPACNRIRRTGQKIYLDLAVTIGHVGNKVFNYSDL